MSLKHLFAKFDYYAQPEGHDPLNKLMGISKYAVATGTFIGMTDILMKSKTTTLYDSSRCLGFWIIPLTGMGCAFASTTYMATNLRGKDDPFNYVIGACAAGGVLGLWSKCFLTTLYGTIILSIFAACKKDSKESGWEFLPLLKEPITQMKSTPFFRTEASKMKIHERGWTT